VRLHWRRWFRCLRLLVLPMRKPTRLYLTLSEPHRRARSAWGSLALSSGSSFPPCRGSTTPGRWLSSRSSAPPAVRLRATSLSTNPAVKRLRSPRWSLAWPVCSLPSWSPSKASVGSGRNDGNRPLKSTCEPRRNNAPSKRPRRAPGSSGGPAPGFVWPCRAFQCRVAGPRVWKQRRWAGCATAPRCGFPSRLACFSVPA